MPKPSTLRKTPLLALASISLVSSSSLGDADVEVAVGGQDDAVGAVLDEVLGGDVVGELDARRRRWSSRRPASCSMRREDLGLVVARASRAGPGPRRRRRRRSPPGRSRRAARPAAAATHFTSGSLLASAIEPETSIRKTRLLGGRSFWSIGLPAMPIRASRCSAFQGQPATSTWTGERVAAARRRGRIVVGEVVEQLLDPDGVLGRQLVLLQQEAADVGVAGRVDVDREGRERLLDGPHEGILLNPVERLAVAARPLGWEPENAFASNRCWNGLLHRLSLAVLAVCCWGGRSGRSGLLSRLVLPVLVECRYGGRSRRSRSLLGGGIPESTGRRRPGRRRVLCNLELLPIFTGRRTSVATLHLVRGVLLSIRARGGRIRIRDHRRSWRAPGRTGNHRVLCLRAEICLLGEGILLLHGTIAEIGIGIGLLGGHRSAGSRRGLPPSSGAAHQVEALRHHARAKAAPGASDRKLNPAHRRRGMIDRSGHLPTRASHHLPGLQSESGLPPLFIGGLDSDFLHQTDIGGHGLLGSLCALEPRLIFPERFSVQHWSVRVGRAYRSPDDVRVSEGSCLRLGGYGGELDFLSMTVTVSSQGEQSNRSTHQQRGRHRHEPVRPAPPGAAVRGGDRGRECLVDQPVVSQRQGRHGLRLFLQLFGKPLCGLANLGDVIAGLLAVGQELLDLGSFGGIRARPGRMRSVGGRWRRRSSLVLLWRVQARASTGWPSKSCPRSVLIPAWIR